jgi:hypothetical protein
MQAFNTLWQASQVRGISSSLIALVPMEAKGETISTSTIPSPAKGTRFAHRAPALVRP